MKKDYAAIAASTIAALLLAVYPAVAGDAGKKAGGSISTDTSVTTETKPDGSVSGGVSTGGTLSTDSPSASPRMDDAEKKTGLDRADEAAGQHGQQGRDNAREHQEQKDSPSASPSMDEQKKDESTPAQDKK